MIISKILIKRSSLYYVRTKGEWRGQVKGVRLRTRVGKGGVGGSRLRTYAKKIFLATKSQNISFFCTKEAVTLPSIVCRKVQTGLKL